MTVERRLHQSALNASAAAVNETYFAKPCIRGGFNVFLDHRNDVGSRKGMQINLVLDWNVNGIGHRD